MLRVLRGFLAAFILFYLPVVRAEEQNDQLIFISDSHSVGEFGVTINTWLRSRAQTSFVFFASGGSAPLQWRNGIFTSTCATYDHSSLPSQPKKGCQKLLTPPLSSLYSRNSDSPSAFHSTTTLIALGTNISTHPARVSDEIKWTKKLLHDVTMNQSNCIWIGPPLMTKFTSDEIEGRYSIIRSAIEQEANETGKKPCTLIDSRLMSRYPESLTNPAIKPDGIHYDVPGAVYVEGVASARQWGEATILQLEDHLSTNSR